MIPFISSMNILLNFLFFVFFSTITTPNLAYGGVAFRMQPSVSVVKHDGSVALNFIGRAYAFIGSGPNANEKLYMGTSCDLAGNCGVESSNKNASAEFIDGVAQFEDLLIQRTGVYTLYYIGYDSTDRTFASVYSNTFSVYLGSPYKLSFIQTIGNAFGGIPFSPNPILALVDRGNNPITVANTGTITATLSKSVNGSLLQPESKTVVPIVEGIAVFAGLYINEAGSYNISFMTSLNPSGSNNITSNQFTVAIGPVASLKPLTSMKSHTVLGGEFIKVPPKFLLLDAGGNIIKDDCISKVTVEIFNNPGGAKLLPVENLAAIAENGTIHFTSIYLDKIGFNYILLFRHFIHSGIGNITFYATGVEYYTEEFNVLIGPPRALSSVVTSGQAWAGAQPFVQQPVLQLVDYGGNVQSKDFSTLLNTTLTHSLTVDKIIKIDTRKSDTVYIVSMQVNKAFHTVPAGTDVIITVNFLHEVTVTGAGDPYILLIASAGDSGLLRMAKLIGQRSRTTALRFLYTVQLNDYIPGNAALDYVNYTSLYTGGCKILDGNKKTVDLQMPVVDGKSSLAPMYRVHIDTSTPYIIGISYDVPDGEYGVGQHIHFFVTFSAPVAVRGIPYIVLNTQNQSAPGKAIYQKHFMNNSKILDFLYVVSIGDDVTTLGIKNKTIQNDPWYIRNYTVQVDPGRVIQYQLANVSNPGIFRDADHPITSINSTIPIDIFNANICIDTSPPIIDVTYGVQTTVANGVYYPGDSIPLTISFNKPVIVQGHSAILFLVTGRNVMSGPPIEAAVFNRLLPDNKTIEFVYVVKENCNTSALDIYQNGSALQYIAADNGIRRLSTVPTTLVNPSTKALSASKRTLTLLSRVKLYGAAPHIVSVTAVDINGAALVGQTLSPDDFILLIVTFSTPVVVTCSPVIVIAVGVEREATFVSGNDSNALVFKYTIQVGDESGGLYYRYVPNALCTVTGCPSETSCRILTKSAHPTQPAELQMPFKGGSKKVGVRLGDVNIVPHLVSRNTTVVNIVCTNPSREYGSGEVLYFLVTFSDEVLFSLSDDFRVYPRLLLNNNRFGNYKHGVGTKEFLFSYVIQPDGYDVNVAHLNIANYTQRLPAVHCIRSDGCYLVNRVNQVVNVSTIQLYSAGIGKDISIYIQPPVITNVWSDKKTSPYDGFYSVGEVIDIFVRFDRPIMIIGTAPKLAVDLNNGPRYADFQRMVNNDTFLFQLQIVIGDHTTDLSHIGVNALIRENSQSRIYRTADIPTTEVNYDMPTRTQLAVSPNKITIRTDVVPTVTAITTDTVDGIYAPGDVIIINIFFSNYVLVDGTPFLLLNTGGKFTHAPVLINSTVRPNIIPTKVLYFKYVVKAGDVSSDLDYVDTASLRRGNDQYQFIYPDQLQVATLSRGINAYHHLGGIALASTNPTVKAVLDLPVPGGKGSLSYGRSIEIDGTVPYTTTLEIVADSGVYGVDFVVDIKMDFSRHVVVTGTPRILLETGEYDRYANYIGGSGTSLLMFRYVVQIGDTTPALDYHSNRAALLSSHSSFELNGGSVLSYSSHPCLPAFVYLNPVGGYLTGTTSNVPLAGVFIFNDLSIPVRGPDYLVRFTCTPSAADYRSITTTQLVFVSFSNEFELRPKEALNGHLVGQSVSIDGPLAVLGSPYSNLTQYAVQTVTTSSGSSIVPQQQIQILTVEVAPQPVIQKFHTNAAPYATVDGFFTINYGLLGPSRPIPANAHPDQIHAILAYDMPKLGNVTATREPYIYCGCEGAYTWTLTFHDLTRGFFASIRLDGSELTGDGASVVGPEIIQSSAFIKGTFRLIGHGVSTDDIPYDAGATEMATALLQLEYPVSDIQISFPDASRGRSWTITFGAYQNSYDVPLLEGNATGLSGGDVTVWAEIAQPGLNGPQSPTSGGLYGGFKLEWRGSTTQYLAYNASAEQVKVALEALPVIESVEVTRSPPGFAVGFTWTITFIGIRYDSDYGYLTDIMGDLEPMIAHNYLIGSNTTITVGAVWNSSMGYNIGGAEVEGSYGAWAGAVYVFQHFNSDWQQVARLRGNDTNAADQFGTSVSISGDVIIVGAIGVAFQGVIEKQSIYCSARNGTFSLSFRGWQTPPLSFNITRDYLMYAITKNLVSVSRIAIDEWGGGGLCEGHTALITFYSPVNGFPSDDQGTYTGGYLEPLKVIDNKLTNLDFGPGIINVTIVQKGNRFVNGKNALDTVTGAAYIFRAKYSCLTNQTICRYSRWEQEAQFIPPGATGFERYGSSVAMTTNLCVVGAPGYSENSGAIYVYKYNTVTKSWRLLNTLTGSVWSFSPGDLFGFSVAFNSKTLVVGSPGRNSSRGSVYIFKPSVTGQYQAHQEVRPLGGPYALLPHSFYGSSVAISGNALVIGACLQDVATVYLGRNLARVTENTGRVYVYQRSAYGDTFAFFQVLSPSNVRHLDRFGWSVAIDTTIPDANVVVVGAVEDFKGKLGASKAIMEVKAAANFAGPIPVGGSFQLKWKQENSTNGFIYQKTRPILYNTDIETMKYILQQDLHTGNVIVSRTNKGTYDNGYIWTITFVGQTSYVNILEVDATEMTGTNVTVTVNYTNESPLEVRGKTHVFTRLSTLDHFKEQAYATPFAHQPIDRCGYAVAISGAYALVGCPNRDSFTSNRNHGSGMIYDLTLLNIQFSSSKYYVREGHSLTVNVVRRSSVSADISLFMRTLDRNADEDTQTYLGDLFGVIKTSNSFPYLIADTTKTVGTAVARAQHSRWIDGVYDYRALSDYEPVLAATAFLTEYSKVNYSISTLADGILEMPDENATLVIYSPGLWPSILGNLFATFVIEDNGDGFEPSNNTLQYDKLSSIDVSVHGEVGHAVGINSDVEMLVSGLPRTTVNGSENAGVVNVFRILLFHWAQIATLQSPKPVSNGYFGDDVKINKAYGRNATTIAVTEPGVGCVHVFSWTTGKVFTLEGTLTVPGALLLTDRFAAKNTMSIDGDLIVIGAPGLEAIYLFLRTQNYATGEFMWTLSDMLRSSDFDYDFLFSYIRLHRQEFGTSVAVSGRTVAVGAPYADYDKLGTELVEVDWDTEGTDIFSTGRGKAYVFYRAAPEQIVHLRAQQVLRSGTFKLVYPGQNNVNYTTSQISFAASTDDMKAALEALVSIYEVTVTKSESILGVNGVNYLWTITFDSAYSNPPVLKAIWNGNECPTCDAFDYPFINSSQVIETHLSTPLGDWVQYPPILANDRRQGDQFGSNIALDGDQLAVSAIYSSAVATTTWDFECGCLEGWNVKGTAFSSQPTYGDNSRARSVYRGNPAISLLGSGQSSNLAGRYYLGTYELRPGNISNYKDPNTTYVAGSIQGDTPIGSITSQPFIIYGTMISFLIGGGCDPSTVYVELLVDGFGVYRSSGKCVERMERVSYNVSVFQNRAAQIRVVDAGTSKWGHINVDDFQFDWDVRGGIVNGTSRITDRPVYGGRLETAHTGAVYLFRRQFSTSSIQFCISNIITCAWVFQTKVTSSDKRAFDKFGTSLVVNDTAGVLVVGSPQTAYTGFYKETPSVYPFRNETTGISNTYGLHFPVLPSYEELFQEQPSKTGQTSGASGVWLLRENENVEPDVRASENAGAVYVFVRDPANVNGGIVVADYHWYCTESTKIQPPDEFARDYFGSSLSLSSDMLVIGSPGQDLFNEDAGAMYLFRTRFSALSFVQAEFRVLEGDVGHALITIFRNALIYAGDITIEYATSDLTARAVNATHFEHCLQIPPHRRGSAGCGDYKQSNGFLTIPEGSNYGAIQVPIVDNLCLDSFLKYIQVTLSVPGSAALQGESLSAKIRKDDDDFSEPLCEY